MMILQAFGARQSLDPLSRVQAFVLTRLIPFNHGDLRWALAAFALRLLGGAVAFGERQMSRWARRVLATAAARRGDLPIKTARRRRYRSPASRAR